MKNCKKCKFGVMFLQKLQKTIDFFVINSII